VDVGRLVGRVEELAAANRKLERELSSLRSGSVFDDAVASAEQVGKVRLVVFRAEALSGDELLELADRLKSKLAPAGVLLGAAHPDGKVSLVASMSDDAVAAGMKAGDVIKTVAPIVGGGGGGRPNMARAGGRDGARLDEALAAGRDALHGVQG
jgi:alanyl-tRNA synthetase